MKIARPSPNDYPPSFSPIPNEIVPDPEQGSSPAFNSLPGKTGRFWALTSNRILYVVAMNHAVNDGSVYLLSSLLPDVQKLFSLSYLQIGVLIATGYLVSVICQPIVGRYGEKKEPSKLLAVGIALVAVSITSFIFSTGFPSLLASQILLRVGSSFFHPIGIAAVSRTYAGSGLQRAMGFQSAFGNLGVLMIFLTAGSINAIAGWQFTFILFTIVAMTDVIVTLTAFRRVSFRSEAQTRMRIEHAARNTSRTPLFFLVVAFVSGGSYAVILNFANIFLSRPFTTLVTAQSNLVVSAFIGSAFLGALSTGLWTRFVKTGPSLAFSYLFSAITIILFATFPGNLFFAAITLLACGFTISATYPLTYTALSNHIVRNPNRSGSSFGALSSAQTVGASVMGLITGIIGSVLGPASPFIAVGTIMLLACFATIIRTRQTASPLQTPETVEPIPAIDPAPKPDNPESIRQNVISTPM